jgi:hypothetical protein
MNFKNMNNSRVRIETEPKKFVEFQSVIKACQALGIGNFSSYQRALCAIEARYGFNYQIIHVSKIKEEQAKQKAKKRKKAKNYAREKFAPIPANGKPMKRLNMDVKEITAKPRKGSRNWKKACEYLQKRENKQVKAVNNSKQTEKTNAGKVSGMFPESTKVTKAHTAAKRAKLENEYIPSNNSSEYKKYKGKGTKGNKRGTQVGTQTTFL